MLTEVSILPIQSMYFIGDRAITAEVLYEEPLIVRFVNVLSHEECDALIESAKSRLQRSKLANKEVNQIRTSSGMFFEENESPLIHDIEQRVAQLMHLPIDHAEGLQVLRYEPGQEFKAHFDYFSADHPSSNNNRISTLVLYLNDVEEGGNTTFPNLNLSTIPTKGAAVYFEYFYNNTALNELNLH
ncbi:MAG: 2OG-Fe(II) oxygenase, partial [Lysinibacillus sp.]